MPQTLEQQVRKMDDGETPVKEMTRQIAETLEANEKTCRSYIYAKRLGFSSNYEYDKSLAKKRGTTRARKVAKNWRRKFGNLTFAVNYYCNLRGYDSSIEYQKELARRHGFETPEQLRAFRKSEPIPSSRSEKIVYVNPKILDAFEDYNDPEESQRYRETLSLVREAFAQLSMRERYILARRFITEYTLEEVGEKLAEREVREKDFTKQNIGQIEKRALRKMREYLSEFG